MLILAQERTVMDYLSTTGEWIYQLTRAHYQFLRAKAEKKGIVFLYQMGKVGSSTVMTSLYSQGINKKQQLFWVTFLSKAGIQFFSDLHANGFDSKQDLSSRSIRNIYQKKALATAIQQQRQLHRPYKVISLVRDPVATNLSGFFQNYFWWPPALLAQCEARSGDYLRELATCFFERYPHDVPLTWFDSEMKAVFDIDVFEQDFPATVGYQIYNGPHADLSLIKLEQLDQCYTQAIGDFLAVPDFRLSKANRADDKWYSTLYREFRDYIRFPKTYLDQMYESKMAQHFYTEQEITRFRHKWARP